MRHLIQAAFPPHIMYLLPSWCFLGLSPREGSFFESLSRVFLGRPTLVFHLLCPVLKSMPEFSSLDAH